MTTIRMIMYVAMAYIILKTFPEILTGFDYCVHKFLWLLHQLI